MATATWAPNAVIDLIDFYRKQLAVNDENLTAKRALGMWESLRMWERLATNAEMEDVWKTINLTDDGWLSPMSIFCTEIGNALEQYDKNSKSTRSQYLGELQDIKRLANSLSSKLAGFNQMSDVNNPFLLGSLLTQDELSLLSPAARLTLEHGPELSASRGKFFQKDYCDAFPSVEVLAKRISQAAGTELNALDFRLNQPTKSKGSTARRTYFIQKIATYLTRAGVPYSASTIATFCYIALDDLDIVYDTVRKIATKSAFSEPSIPNLTADQIRLMLEQSEELQRMVRDICFPKPK